MRPKPPPLEGMATARSDGIPGPLCIWLLGGFHVRIGSREIDPAAWRLRKARSLVKLLALTSGHRIHREQIMELLWPHLDPGAASNNLRKILHIVRRTLEPGRDVGLARYVTAHQDVIHLGPPDLVWIDADAFGFAAAEARRRGDATTYERALSLYAGDLLPEDQYEEWSAGHREALSREYLSLLSDLAAIYESQRDEARAIKILQLLVTRDTGREEAHRSLMRLYALTGQRQQALRQYQVLRESLRREFEAEPDVASRRLHDDVLAGRFPRPESAGLTLARPRADLRSTGRTNLPLPLTSFVGRARELAELRERLIRSRQLTLTGAGGVGKTRLALELATRLVQDFPDGVWLADLSVLGDAALVPQAVASALNVREESGRPLAVVLGDYFLAKHALLVLDNCEQVASACAQLAEYLLRRCPDLHVLVTSREVLGMQGEFVHRVSSLSAPDGRRPSPAAEMKQYEAIRLFVDRASLSRPGFDLTDDNASKVSQICAHLDGIPLAIELAAACLKTIPVESIAARLDRRFQLLTGGTRTALPRHQTLLATVDWSYDLLVEPERALLRRLSVFAGGFTLEAAQVVGAGAHSDDMDILKLLGHLVDKSMVLLDQQTGAGRYRLLETVREYLRAKLVEAGEADATRRRHANVFLRLAEEAEPALRGPGQAAWLDRLEAEHDNLRAALEWSLGQESDNTASRIAVALVGYWHGRGHLREGREWLERARRHRRRDAPSLGRVLIGAGRLAFAQDDFESAATSMEEAVALARAGRDPQALMLSLAWLGHATWHRGDRSRGLALCAESHALCRSSAGDAWTTAIALAEIAIVDLHEGRPEQAIPLLDESLMLFRKAGDSAGIAQCLYHLGVQASSQGDYPRAASLMEEALALQRRSGRTPAAATSLGRLGRIALLRGQYREAVTFLEAGIALADQLGKDWDAAYRKCGLGLALLALGETSRAAALFEESLAVHRRAEDKAGIADSLLGLGIVARCQGEYARSRQLLEESLALLRESGDIGGAAGPLYHLGLVACAEGDHQTAMRLLRESVAQHRGRADRPGIADCLEAAATVARLRNEFDRSAQLLGLAGSLREAIGAPRWVIDQPRHDREVAVLRASMGDEAFAAASALGRAVPTNDIDRLFET
jgi:predicted ATPase/DNA-binding SARP family transcriptional activator